MDRGTPRKVTDQAERLWRALLRAGLTVGGELRPILARWAITPPQWDVLLVLADAPVEGIMLSEIGEAMAVTCGNITGLMDRLEEAGWVQRRPHPQDRRVTLASLTEAGQELIREAMPAYRARLQELFSGLTPPQQAGLTGALEQLAEQMSEKREAVGGE